MKISVNVNITRPKKRGDAYYEAIKNFIDFADEVVVVCGAKSDLKLKYPKSDKLKLVYFEWKDTYDHYARSRELGYRECTGDWIFNFDIDYIIHEKDFEYIRNQLETRHCNHNYLYMLKKTCVLTDRYNIKAKVPVAFKKGLNLTYGSGKVATDFGTPFINGVEVDFSDRKVLDVEFFNYNYTFKTKEQAKYSFGKVARDRGKWYGEYDWGKTPEEALNWLLEMFEGQLNREGHWTQIGLEEHPKVMREKIKKLTKDYLGYNLFGRINETK